jgi:hypothetical protein
MLQEATITVHINRISQLFLLPGTSFYSKRSLTPDAEEYIIEQAELLPGRVPICLLIEIPAGETDKADEITTAIRKHFSFLRERSKRKLRSTLQLGWRNLLTGIVFLGILVLLVEAGGKIIPVGGLSITIRELLIILGWVAMWRPAELLLYDWLPHKRNVNLFRRLENSNVQIIEVKND